MSEPKPCAPAAERNKQAIQLALQKILRTGEQVFEFGSGTGQHACHIAAAMPELVWQPSDLDDKLAGIRQWIAESGCNNILPPVKLDLSDTSLPSYKASVCFSANTLHIVDWDQVTQLFRSSAAMLDDGGKLCIYGPYRFNGQHISAGNDQFDKSLRTSDPASGIRDIVDLNKLAQGIGFSEATVIDMPANNHLLVWERNASDPYDTNEGTNV